MYLYDSSLLKQLQKQGESVNIIATRTLFEYLSEDKFALKNMCCTGWYEGQYPLIELNLGLMGRTTVVDDELEEEED